MIKRGYRSTVTLLTLLTVDNRRVFIAPSRTLCTLRKHIVADPTKSFEKDLRSPEVSGDVAVFEQ